MRPQPEVQRVERRTRFFLGAVGAWLALGFLFAAELVTYGHFSIVAAFEVAALTVVPAGLFSIPVWWLTRRQPWSQLPAPLAVAAHAITAVIFGVLMVSIELAASAAIRQTETLHIITSSMGLAALMGTVIYGLVVGASFAIRSQSALQSERAEVNAQRANVAEARSALAAADLATMRARLHPHFLFNALHSISALVRTKPAEADVAIEQLGKMLRAIISDGGTDASRLDDEVELAQTYLAFERRRLGERLSVVVDVDESAGEAVVPRLLLQPLVENAVRHGIEPQGRPATIAIQAVVKGSDLVITVTDDGAGCGPIDWDARGNGLVALRRRLFALYEQRASLVGSSRVDLQACKLEYSIVSPK